MTADSAREGDSMYNIKEIINLIERVQESMGECDFMVFPSPVRALDVGALLTVARENIELQGKIAAALLTGGE